MNWKPEIEAKVRSLLNAWASSIPGNPFPDFGKKLSVVSLDEKPSYVISLSTLYEARYRPVERTKPYSESMEADLASGKTIPPDTVDVWAFESPLKGEFEPQETDIDVPDSFRSVACGTCEGKKNVSCGGCGGSKAVRCPDCRNGKKICEKCSGRGRTPCTNCRGKGHIPGDTKEGKPGPEVLCVDCNGAGSMPCETCKGNGGFPCAKCQSQGTLPCPRCKGQGTQPCIQCSATGKIVRGLSFRIQYADASDRSITHDSKIPEDLLPPDFLWSKTSERIIETQNITVAAPDLSEHPPYAKTAVETLLKKAEGAIAAQPAPARIILQKLLVEKVPVFTVVYRFQDKMYDAWITAVDNKVSAKESPFKNLAREETMKAMQLAAQGDESMAQEILSKASTFGGTDLDLQKVKRVSQTSSARDFLVVHQLFSILAGMALMAFLGASHGPTHHLFWPVFSSGIAVCGVSLAIGYLLAFIKIGWAMNSWSKRLLSSVVIVAVVALSTQIYFAMAQAPYNLDLQEYKGLMAEHFHGALQTDNINPADLDFLKFMVETYEPLGIDVSEAKNALEEAAKIEQDAKDRADAVAKAQAEAHGKKSAKAELLRQEIEAARLKRLQQQAALKSKKKKKKKPAKTSTSYGY